MPCHKYLAPLKAPGMMLWLLSELIFGSVVVAGAGSADAQQASMA